MTQICPGRGVAPVPTWVSVICRPEAVVMVLPAAWAAACVDAPAASRPAHAMGTISEERRILLLLKQGLWDGLSASRSPSEGPSDARPLHAWREARWVSRRA